MKPGPALAAGGGQPEAPRPRTGSGGGARPGGPALDLLDGFIVVTYPRSVVTSRAVGHRLQLVEEFRRAGGCSTIPGEPVELGQAWRCPRRSCPPGRWGAPPERQGGGVHRHVEACSRMARLMWPTRREGRPARPAGTHASSMARRAGARMPPPNGSPALTASILSCAGCLEHHPRAAYRRRVHPWCCAQDPASKALLLPFSRRSRSNRGTGSQVMADRVDGALVPERHQRLEPRHWVSSPGR